MNEVAVAPRLARALEALGRGERVVNVARRKVEEKRIAGFCLGSNPVGCLAGESGSHQFVVIYLVRFFRAANGIGFKFLLKNPCLRLLTVDEWVRFIEADDPVVFDINKRRMTVHHR